MNIIGTFTAFVSALVVTIVIGAISVTRVASGWTRAVWPIRKPA